MDKSFLGILPGPEVQGEPFWCLMEWNNNKLTGNFYGSKQGLCLFFGYIDAEYFKSQMHISYKNNFVVRGLNYEQLKKILYKCEKMRDMIPPIVLILPNSVGSKFKTIQLEINEIRYYIKNKRFKNDGLNNLLNEAIELTENPPEEYIKRTLKFEEYFEYILKLSEKCPRKYPNLPNIINICREKLWEDYNNIGNELEEIKKGLTGEEQLYTQQYKILDTEYEITWVIPLAKKLIDKYNVKSQEFNINEVIKLVDKSNIVDKHLETVADSNEPIILVSYPFTIQSMTLIDGNHRVAAKYRAGREKIEGYLLEPKIHMEAMMLNFHRTSYKVHNNLSEICLYLIYIKEINQVNLLNI